MARPKASPNEKRSVSLHVMTTEQERATIEQHAAVHGLGVSEFVRRRALARPMPSADMRARREQAALTTALLRLGVNLNQIAHHMNAGRSAPDYLTDLIDDIRTHIDRLSSDEPGRDRHG